MLKIQQKISLFDGNSDCSSGIVLSAAVSAVTEMFLSVSLCFRGNHCSHFTVPILDHRHSSLAGRQEDRAFYNAPLRLSVTLKQRPHWWIISTVLHLFRQESSANFLLPNIPKCWTLTRCYVRYFLLLNIFVHFDLFCLIHFHAFILYKKKTKPVNPELGKSLRPPWVSSKLSLSTELLPTSLFVRVLWSSNESYI